MCKYMSYPASKSKLCSKKMQQLRLLDLKVPRMPSSAAAEVSFSVSLSCRLACRVDEQKAGGHYEPAVFAVSI